MFKRNIILLKFSFKVEREIPYFKNSYFNYCFAKIQLKSNRYLNFQTVDVITKYTYIYTHNQAGVPMKGLLGQGSR